MNEILPKIKKIHSESIRLEKPFEDVAQRFAHIPGTVVLLSGGDLDCARYHILGTKPWLGLSGRHHDIILTSVTQTRYENANPFDILDKLIRTHRLADEAGLSEMSYFPMASGFMGYLSYDLKDCLEVLPRTSVDRSGLPHIQLYAPSIIVVHDKIENTTRLFITELEGIPDYSATKLKNFFHATRHTPLFSEEDKIITGPLKSNFKQDHYMRTIQKIIEYIKSGHVYQVNMSQRFEADFQGNPYRLFKRYFQLNPAPFFAYINADDHHIVSTSPERFLVQHNREVETRPIKGTRPRGKTEEEDRRLRDKLYNSKKDDAELSMIVDLMRNDIGRICTGGSVYVAEHKRVEVYQNVYHLVSVVKGTLADPNNSVDLIRATFPGGSITGCPKIRSMEIIDELEPDRRHVYTGSIGYISFHDTMDLSIAIRTATIFNEKLAFSVGGGIVFDSDPQKEFEETLHKGQTLMSAFQTSDERCQTTEMVWLNGMLIPAHTAGIPVRDLGIQYGFGFFETIRAENGKALNLPGHVKRFEHTWAQLFKDLIPDLTWDVIIQQVLEANSLDCQTAAVKIMATKGNRDTAPYNHSLVVTARPYTHRLAGRTEPGLHLITYPFPRQTPLADHKTLNYLYYHMAGQWAKECGKDEAVILNPDNSVSETNTASFICIHQKLAILPESKAVLPGTMQNAVLNVLEQWGYEVRHKPLHIEDLFSFEDVLVTNALMGAVPVLSIDGKALPVPSDLWQRINEGVRREA